MKPKQETYYGWRQCMVDDNPWNRKNGVGKKKSKSDLEGLEIIELYVHSQMIERVYT